MTPDLGRLLAAVRVGPGGSACRIPVGDGELLAVNGARGD